MHKPKPYVPDLFYPKNRAERRKARRDGYPARPGWHFGGLHFGGDPIPGFVDGGVRVGDFVTFDIEQRDAHMLKPTEGVAVVEVNNRVIVVTGRRRRQVVQAHAGHGAHVVVHDTPEGNS